jgi:hypothetical protein
MEKSRYMMSRIPALPTTASNMATPLLKPYDMFLKSCCLSFSQRPR